VEYFFGFYKTRHILLFDSANCTVLHDVVLTQYRRVTDGQTDGRTDRQIDGNVIHRVTAVFVHFVGQALRYVCHSDVSRRHFLNKIAIVRTFLERTDSILFE